MRAKNATRHLMFVEPSDWRVRCERFVERLVNYPNHMRCIIGLFVAVVPFFRSIYGFVLVKNCVQYFAEYMYRVDMFIAVCHQILNRDSSLTYRKEMDPCGPPRTQTCIGAVQDGLPSL